MQSGVTVQVPATTANLGPGFDCLALSLDLWNTTIFSPADGSDAPEIEVEGEGAAQLPRDHSNLILRAAETVFGRFEQSLTGVHIRCINQIPLGSGLGSSAAAILAGLLGANAWLGSPLGGSELLDLAVKLEGHADNVTAALYGGLITVIRLADGGCLVRRFDLPVWQAAYVLPEVNLPTRLARAVLPPLVRMEDAIFNIGRAVLVADALRTGSPDLLRKITEDRLHQPYRLPLIAGADDALAAAQQAGAAAMLSGAGPSLIAFLQTDPAPIRAAMAGAFQSAGIGTRVFSLKTTNHGADVHIHCG